MRRIPRERLRTWLVPAAVGAGAAIAIGATGGGWRNGAVAGASLTTFFGLMETLLGARKALEKN